LPKYTAENASLDCYNDLLLSIFISMNKNVRFVYPIRQRKTADIMGESPSNV